MRYSNLKGYAAINKNKRNHSEILNLTIQNPLNDSQALTSPKPIASTYSPNLKMKRVSKSNFPSSSNEKSIAYKKNVPTHQGISSKQWLTWNLNSCRLDVFFYNGNILHNEQ